MCSFGGSSRIGVLVLVTLLAVAAPAVADPGQLDATFGTAGRAIVPFDGQATPSDLVVENDGAVVATGSVAGLQGLVTVRFLADGSLDPGFGAGGVARVDVPSSGAVALDRDAEGRVLVAGRRFGPAGPALLVARLRADGSPDPAFGSDGVVIGATGIAPAFPSAMAIDAHDRILVAGVDTTDGSGSVVVSRLLADGSPDPAFGAGGRALVGGALSSVPAHGLVATRDGGAAVVLSSAAAAGQDRRTATVYRLTADGRPDAGFGGAGAVEVPEADAVALAEQPDGRLVVGGTAFEQRGADHTSWMALARFEPTGALDAGFGTGGLVRVGDPAVGASIGDLLIEPDGAIVAGGRIGAGEGLARLRSDGTLDPGFGAGGLAGAENPTPWMRSIVALGRDSNGRLLSADQQNPVPPLGPSCGFGSSGPPPPTPTFEVARWTGAALAAPAASARRHSPQAHAACSLVPPHLGLQGTRVVMAPSGRVRLTLTCSGGFGACAGLLRLRRPPGSARPLRLGAPRPFSVAVAQRRVITLRLTRSQRRAVRRGRRLLVLLETMPRASRSPTWTLVTDLVVAAPRSPHARGLSPTVRQSGSSGTLRPGSRPRRRPRTRALVP